MIYITYKNDFDNNLNVKSIYNVYNYDVEKEYITFMHKKADDINIIINAHWLNIMNYDNHHSNLSKQEYKAKKKEWDKILSKWTVDRFIVEVLKGHKLAFKEILNF